ncbi:MAG: entericidin [Akkermansiaceae bacterium]|nr:entericidin [Akkermansiaceae bacterium]
MKRILILTATLVACSLAVTSCNTIGGVGKDVKSVGSDISGAAEAASGSL